MRTTEACRAMYLPGRASIRRATLPEPPAPRVSDSASRIRAAAVCRGRAAARDVAWDLTTEIAVACHLCARDALRVLRWALATERRYAEFRAAMRANRDGNREPLARLVAEFEGGTP